MKILFLLLCAVSAAFGQFAPPISIMGSLVSASTIAPIGPITSVSGTTAITTITPPTYFTTSGAGGCLVLIATGAWPMNATAVTFTASAGTAYTFCYSAATSTWYGGPTGGGGGGGGLRTINGLGVGGLNNVGSGLYPAWVLQNNAAGLSQALVATVGASITFANTGTPTISKSFWIPDDFSSALKLTVFLDDSQVAGGHVQFDYGLVCWVSGSAPTNTMANTASTGSVAFTGAGNAQQTAALVIPTSGCSAGSQAIIQIARNNTVGSNMAAPVSLVDVKATYISAY